MPRVADGMKLPHAHGRRDPSSSLIGDGSSFTVFTQLGSRALFS